ncbi:unnamed protein product [[Candida] boidinii]|uniref:Unnamed protein product n=1 Tax=Candida boidinii TaxID=5477 RepID=A0A9W6TAD7_CANBO|nr:unnamed protein product [[Candida] boidinii]
MECHASKSISSKISDNSIDSGSRKIFGRKLGKSRRDLHITGTKSNNTITTNKSLIEFSTMVFKVTLEHLVRDSGVHQVLDKQFERLVIPCLVINTNTGVKVHSTSVNEVHETQTKRRNLDSKKRGPLVEVSSTRKLEAIWKLDRSIGLTHNLLNADQVSG